jgi:multiple sugar transport system ATP-binding protein
MAVMESGQIRQVGTPSDIFHRPVNVFVANFIGSTPMNLVPAVVAGAAQGAHLMLGEVRLPMPSTAAGLLHDDSEEVLLGSRPEYTDLSTEQRPDSLRGTVVVVENLGATALVSVETGGQIVKAVVPEGEEPRIGESVWMTPQNSRALVYRQIDGLLVARNKESATDASAESATA